jgi:methylated-DNA-[protein]-cysteine S-methyltransferase
MQAIVESERVRVERTRYEVPDWGEGELWRSTGVVLAHEFDFGRPARDCSAMMRSDHADACELVARIRAFLAGDDVGFDDVSLDLDWCTDFQRAALTVLRSIPRGEVVTYGELAALAGRPGAQRAAGTFCAQNRFLIFVPCHRVVAAGGIGGYGSAGVKVKRRLLALEGLQL